MAWLEFAEGHAVDAVAGALDGRLNGDEVEELSLDVIGNIRADADETAGAADAAFVCITASLACCGCFCRY